MPHSATQTLRVVGAVLVHEDGQRFLVTQRAEDDSHGGKWEFPGGRVEPLEVDDEALIREMEEELGIEVEVGRLLKRVQLPISETVTLDFRAYLCSLSYGDPKPYAAQALRWVTVEEARKLSMPPADGPVLDLLAQDGLT